MYQGIHFWKSSAGHQHLLAAPGHLDSFDQRLQIPSEGVGCRVSDSALLGTEEGKVEGSLSFYLHSKSSGVQ